MKEFRSAGQILFGFLPEQTVDLGGRVWKVREWRNPIMRAVDPTTLRREVIKAATPWAMAEMDGDFVKHLRQGRDIFVFSLDRKNGVNVEEFPKVWMCKQRACSRVYFSGKPERCKCGAQSLGQLPFVGFHACGDIREPWVRPCARHDDIAVRLPGTSSAAEIEFYCPSSDCGRLLQRGLGFVRCSCGAGTDAADRQLRFTVHRAAAVYTPQTIVIVNPPSLERVKRLNDAGGGARALAWALSGFELRKAEDVGLTLDAFVRDLVSKGISEALAREMATRAVDAGELRQNEDDANVPQPQREEAMAEAVTVALATDESRTRTADLVGRVTNDDWSVRANTYRHLYPSALARAGIQDVELVEKFPVLTGHFGYTRGGGAAGSGKLRAFQRDRRYAVYADIAQTEALFVRLKPKLVAEWLGAKGHSLEPWVDDRSARLSILRSIDVPARGEERDVESVGTDVLRLVHSYAHRFIRRIAVFAGIDRNALSELIVPHHLGFFAYASARGDFVLGGLQAVFESELHHVLDDFVLSDHRCPLDPGCRRVGSACVACLHLGEPSCRYFNRFLGRDALYGHDGYLNLCIRRRVE